MKSVIKVFLDPTDRLAFKAQSVKRDSQENQENLENLEKKVFQEHLAHLEMPVKWEFLANPVKEVGVENPVFPVKEDYVVSLDHMEIKVKLVFQEKEVM